MHNSKYVFMKCWHIPVMEPYAPNPCLKFDRYCETALKKNEFKLLLPESESCSVVSDSLRPRGLHIPWNSPGQNTGVGSHSHLPRIFPTQGLKPGLPCCRRTLISWATREAQEYWSGWPIPSAADLPSCIAGGFFTSWATREAHSLQKCKAKITPQQCFN